jgi:hypothetical protein
MQLRKKSRLLRGTMSLAVSTTIHGVCTHTWCHVVGAVNFTGVHHLRSPEDEWTEKTRLTHRSCSQKKDTKGSGTRAHSEATTEIF